MRIVFFCNHVVSHPALHWLMQKGVLAGVVVSDYGHAFSGEVQGLAEAENVPFFACGRTQLKNDLVQWLEGVAPDAIAVMTFPYRLPEQILVLPPQGCWNVHLGLLPAYRGPDPVFWQIRNGEACGGLTLHQMEKSFDSGKVLWSRELELDAGEVLGTHLTKLAHLGPSSMDALCGYLKYGVGELSEQKEVQACYHSRPAKQDLMIDWGQMDAEEIDRMVRACNPSYPGAVTSIRTVPVSLHEVTVIPLTDPPEEPAGTVVEAPGDPNLYILCRNGACLRVEVVSSQDILCSGVRFRHLFQLKSGEHFGG